VDYVVFGIGMGASLVLAGIVGRTAGPSLRYRTSRTAGEVLKAEELVARVAWLRFCGSLGAALAIGGFFLLIVTGIAMALRLSDTVATISVGLALFAVIVLMGFWTWAFVNRFGLYGIVADRPRQAKLTSESQSEELARQARVPKPDREKKQKEPEPVVDSPIPTIGPEAPAVTTSGQQSKRTFKPWSTPAEPENAKSEPTVSPTTSPRIDPSRSEVVNPSDAAALERILSEPDPVPTEGAPAVSPAGEEAETADAEIDANASELVDDSSPEEPSADQQADGEDSSSIPAAPWNRRKQQRR
jgi:hypothetical protein